MNFKMRNLLWLFALTAACTRPVEEGTSLSIQLPSKAAMSSGTSSVALFNVGPKTAASLSIAPNNFVPLNTDSPFNTMLNPSDITGFDCFAVLVGGGDFNQKGMCTTSDGQTFPVGAAVGGVPAGRSLNLSVKSGTRDIILMGFNVQEATDCHDFFGANMPHGRVSQPHILSKISTNLPSGNATVTLNASYSAQKITDCHFAAGDGGRSGGFYGNGIDGDLTFSGSFTQLTTQLGAPGRYLTSISAVTAITNVATAALPNHVRIDVASPWTTSNLDVR